METHVVSAEFLRRVCQTAADRYNLPDVEALDTGAPFWNEGTRIYHLSENFLSRLDAALPPQPWKPGIHRTVADSLKCGTGKVHSGIQELITRGKRNPQRDGIVYDAKGGVLAVDTDRVSELPKSKASE